MTRLLFIATILALVALTACSEPPQRDAPAPTATLQPTTTEASIPTREAPARIPDTATPPAPFTLTAAPQSAVTLAPAPTSKPEPTATATPSPTPTPTATPVPTPTEQPPQQATPTLAPTATAIPTPEPTPAPTATSLPTATLVPPPDADSTTWRSITVAAEDRCSPYNPDDYPYSRSVEPRIVAEQGGIYGPYTGTWFETIKETDIEHIVARSEAHDSGLCAATATVRSQFASDLLNLTLASPSVNRHQKSDHDAAEWLPALNQCWYVERVVQVRLQYDLTIDPDEAQAIDQVLAGCASTDLVIVAPGEAVAASPTPPPASDVDALALYDNNGNGRITCSEARAHGIAPVHRGHPAYEYMSDRDGDGVVCE